ncbi:MAG: thioesterase family protein, partial [Robiginitomaculum sp.]|nr:thioesterase family protein [Robiginitomaculum sp.]
MGEFCETYRGEALSWEADELGHMNMRYYFDRAAQARAHFFSRLGLPGMFKARAFSTVIPTSQHINYHKEIRPGHGMAVQTAIVHLGETDITLAHIITKTPQILSATIVETLSHISRRTGKTFSWPRRLKDRAPKFIVDIPDIAKARNINLDEPLGSPSFKAADKLGLPAIGRGMFSPNECDAHGFVNHSA